MIACENIIIAKFEMQEIALPARECLDRVQIGSLPHDPGGITCMLTSGVKNDDTYLLKAIVFVLTIPVVRST